MKKPNASARAAVTRVIDYNVMTQAIANAALSRRAALQIELAVSLIHFTQESGGTDTIGKAALKNVYNDAGYICIAKADRDYKTVNRRLNAMAKLFDKFGSALVYSWITTASTVEGVIADVGTEAIINHVVVELVAFGFDTLDDVLAYVGVETNRTRQPRQSSGPVTVTTPAPAAAPVAAPIAASAASASLEEMYVTLTEGFGPEVLREFCTQLLTHVAAVELKQDEKEYDTQERLAASADKSLTESAKVLAELSARQSAPMEARTGRFAA